ncbi:ABC transporter ATP-binding protein [Streptomyces malachitofuscus]|nr:ABC transporter ATP-binding protein [Streptomyces malachitofuscus]
MLGPGRPGADVSRQPAVALRVEAVRKGFGSRQVLRGVSFEARAGQLLGIVGENGAGKTTLLRVLSGDLRPDGGRVALVGTRGYCPQHPVLDEELTVRQHLRLFQVAYRLPSPGSALRLIERLSAADYLDAQVKVLSGGTLQKLNLVLALMHDPDVVLLDEPYQGFDWETYLRFWDLAQELKDRGRTVIIISHLAHDTERLDVLHHLRDGLLETSPPTDTT